MSRNAGRNCGRQGRDRAEPYLGPNDGEEAQKEEFNPFEVKNTEVKPLFLCRFGSSFPKQNLSVGVLAAKYPQWLL